MKMPIKKALVWKTGSGSAVLTIPADYISNGQIKVGGEYDVEIEVEEE